MRSLAVIYFLLFFGSAAAAAAAAAPPVKRALIIAIGRYPDPAKNGWPPIHCYNDIPLMTGALRFQGFTDNNITVLKDEEGTKANIETALDQLTRQCGKGDIVVILYSGHGEQLMDDNGDEPDNYDECIVPYGAVFSEDPAAFARYQSGYIRDDELGEKLAQLRNKLGKNGDLLVLMDACYSATGTRGIEDDGPRVRGGNLPMKGPGFKAGGADRQVMQQEIKGTRLDADASGFAVISAAQGKNYECVDDDGKTPVGSLTYAASKALTGTKGSMSYRAFFSKIESMMRKTSPNQRPAIETDNLDSALFKGNVTAQQPFFTINPDNSNSLELELNGGSVAGITPGSLVQLFPVGTPQAKGHTPLATGKIEETGYFKSRVLLDKPDEAIVNASPYVFVTEQAYGSDSIRLAVHHIDDMPQKVAAGLKDFPAVTTAGANAALYLDTINGNPGTWQLKDNSTGTRFGSYNIKPGDPEGMTQLKEALKVYKRYAYLKNLEVEEENLYVEVKIVFRDDKGQPDNGKLNARTNNGRLELRKGDIIFLQIANTCNRECYVNIVDLQPDGIINPLIPNRHLRNILNQPAPVVPEDCKLAPGDTLRLMNKLPIKIGPPFGPENFKIILSAEPLDLEGILTNGKNTKGVFSKMVEVFTAGDNGGRRGSYDPGQTGTVTSLPFTIVP